MGLEVGAIARGADKESLAGVRPRIETVPPTDAPAAYDRTMAGDARFRMVLTTG